MDKKRGIVLFDEGTEGIEMLCIDDNGFLQIPNNQLEKIIRLDSGTKKRAIGLIKDDISEYK